MPLSLMPSIAALVLTVNLTVTLPVESSATLDPCSEQLSTCLCQKLLQTHMGQQHSAQSSRISGFICLLQFCHSTYQLLHQQQHLLVPQVRALPQQTC